MAALFFSYIPLIIYAEFNVLVLMVWHDSHTLRVMLFRLTASVTQTNQVQSDPGAMAFAGADGRKAVGGHVLAHASTTRVLLRKGRGEERVAKVQDSPGKCSVSCICSRSVFANTSFRCCRRRSDLCHYERWHR